MLKLLLYTAFALENFISVYPPAKYEGVDQHGIPCSASVLDLFKLQNKVEYQVTIHSEQFPNYRFVFYYEEDAPNLVVKALDDDKGYKVEWLGWNHALSKVRFNYDKQQITLERIGREVNWPSIECRVKK